MYVFTNSIVLLLFSKTAHSIILPQSGISFTGDFSHLVNAWLGPGNTLHFYCWKNYLSLQFRLLDNSSTSLLNNKVSFRAHRCRIFVWVPLTRLAFKNVSNSLANSSMHIKSTLMLRNVSQLMLEDWSFESNPGVIES